MILFIIYVIPLGGAEVQSFSRFQLSLKMKTRFQSSVFQYSFKIITERKTEFFGLPYHL